MPQASEMQRVVFFHNTVKVIVNTVISIVVSQKCVEKQKDQFDRLLKQY